MYDRAAIAKEAHRIANGFVPKIRGRRRYDHRYRTYRAALAEGFRWAWSRAKHDAQLARIESALTPEHRVARDEAKAHAAARHWEIIAIQCFTDGPLSSVDRDRIAALSHAA